MNITSLGVLKCVLTPAEIMSNICAAKFWGGSKGERTGGPDPQENHKWLYIYAALEILVHALRVQLLLEVGPCEPL